MGMDRCDPHPSGRCALGPGERDRSSDHERGRAGGHDDHGRDRGCNLGHEHGLAGSSGYSTVKSAVNLARIIPQIEAKQ